MDPHADVGFGSHSRARHLRYQRRHAAAISTRKETSKMLTTDQLGGIIRAVATAITGALVAKGMIDNNTALWIVAGAGTVGVAAWSWWTNRPQKIVDTTTGTPKAS